MSSIEQTVQDRLFELQDLKYRDFQCKLMPTVDPETVIGVRTPEHLAQLEEIFQYYAYLRDTYGMESRNMAEAAGEGHEKER